MDNNKPGQPHCRRKVASRCPKHGLGTRGFRSASGFNRHERRHESTAMFEAARLGERIAMTRLHEIFDHESLGRTDEGAV